MLLTCRVSRIGVWGNEVAAQDQHALKSPFANLRKQTRQADLYLKPSTLNLFIYMNLNPKGKCV